MTQWISEWLAKRYAEMYIVKKEFSLKDAVRAWDIKDSTARKILSELTRRGWIREIIKGKEKTYILASPEEIIFKFATVSRSKVLDVAEEISRKHRDVLFFGSLVTLKYGHGRVEDYLVVITRPYEQHRLEGEKWEIPIEVLGLGDTKMSKNAGLLLHEGRRITIPSHEDSIILFAYCIFYKGLGLRISDYVSLLINMEMIDWEYLLERAEKFNAVKAINLTLAALQIKVRGEILKRLEETAHKEPYPPYWVPKVSDKEIRDAYRKVRELW